MIGIFNLVHYISADDKQDVFDNSMITLELKKVRSYCVERNNDVSNPCGLRVIEEWMKKIAKFDRNALHTANFTFTPNSLIMKIKSKLDFWPTEVCKTCHSKTRAYVEFIRYNVVANQFKELVFADGIFEKIFGVALKDNRIYIPTIGDYAYRMATDSTAVINGTVLNAYACKENSLEYIDLAFNIIGYRSKDDFNVDSNVVSDTTMRLCVPNNPGNDLLSLGVLLQCFRELYTAITQEKNAEDAIFFAEPEADDLSLQNLKKLLYKRFRFEPRYIPVAFNVFLKDRNMDKIYPDNFEVSVEKEEMVIAKTENPFFTNIAPFLVILTLVIMVTVATVYVFIKKRVRT